MSKIEAKVGFFQTLKTDKSGEQYIENSMSRLMTFLAFFCVSVPGTFLVLLNGVKEFIENSLTWEEMIYSLVAIVVLHIIWIAPKQLAKMTEEKGIISQMLNKG